MSRAAALLAAARAARAKIVHVAHRGTPGGLFDRLHHRGAFIEMLRPQTGEAIVEKRRPNAFSGTNLVELVGPPDTSIIVAGFMTHNCVSSTVRAALDHGYRITVAADACATRDLPYASGTIAACDLHRAELAALADRHAHVAVVADLIPLGP